MPFIGTLMDGLISPAKLDLTDPNSFIFVSAYRAAIAELSLDLQLIISAKPGASYSHVLNLARSTRPSNNLNNILRALRSINWQSFGDRLQDEKQKMDEIVHPGSEIRRIIRLQVCTIKKLLAQQISGLENIYASDLFKAQISREIRRELESSFSDLRRLRFTSNSPVMRVTDVTGGKRLPHVMHEVEVSQDDFARMFNSDDATILAIPELERPHFTCRLIFSIHLPGAGQDQYFASELEFSRSQNDYDVARYRNLIRYSRLNGSQLCQLAADRTRPIPTLGWLGFGIVDHDGLVYDWEFWSSRPDPVFLWSPVFSDQSIIALRKKFGEAAKLYVGSVPGPLKFTLLRCQIEQITIFWLDSGPVPLDVIEANGALPIDEETSMEFSHPPQDDRFLAAYVASLHIMPNMLKGLGVDLSP